MDLSNSADHIYSNGVGGPKGVGVVVGRGDIGLVVEEVLNLGGEV